MLKRDIHRNSSRDSYSYLIGNIKNEEFIFCNLKLQLA